MSKAKELDLDNSVRLPSQEDEQTLAAIDEGIRDAQAGRTVSSEEVRKLLPKWTTNSSSPKER